MTIDFEALKRLGWSDDLVDAAKTAIAMIPEEPAAPATEVVLELEPRTYTTDEIDLSETDPVATVEVPTAR